MKASEWIDQLKVARGWESDYRAAKELGVSRNTISNYRSKPDATMDEDTSIRVAQALGAQPELILVDQVIERSKNDEARSALQRALKRLGGAVAGVVLAAGLAAPSPAPAAMDPAATDGLCIMSNEERKRRERERERERRRRNRLPPLDVAIPLDLLAAFAATAAPSRFATL